MKKEELKKLAPEKLLDAALSLHAENEKLTAQVDTLNGELEKAADDFASLSKQLDRAESGKGAKIFGEVKIDKTIYDIVRPKTMYKGHIYTAKEIQEDKELASNLLKIGASILREQTK